MKKIQTLFAKFILAVGFILTSLLSQSQFAYNYLKAADDYYRKGDYYSAAQYYEKYLTGAKGNFSESYNPYNAAGKSKEKQVKGVSRDEVSYKAGESYQLLNNYVKAEPFFKDAAVNTAKFPLAGYWYAKSLKANSKFDEAESEFNKFLSGYSAEDVYKSDGAKELKNLQFRNMQMKRGDLNLFSVNKLAANATSGATSAPVFVGEKLFFSSTRPDSTSDKANPFINKIYEGSLGNQDAAKINIEQPKNEHLEGATFSSDGNTMYVTKWALKDEKKVAAIFMSTKQNDKWSNLLPVEGDINIDNYNSQQPSLAANGSLFYSSNKPGGLGGFDIWMAPVTDGKFGTSVNLGSSVNTPFDEYAPSYFAPAKTLVFSSNGRVGMGGFDFYQSKGSGSDWEEPVNLGYPVNSVKDDIYFVSTSKKYLLDTFFFSSDRASDCCLEMFAGNKLRKKKRVIGKIVDCLSGAPMSGVDVTVTEDEFNNVTIPTKRTNTQGQYEVFLDEYQPFKLKAEAEGYIPKEIEVTKTSMTDTLVNAQICLEQPNKKPFEGENKAIVIDNIYFDYDSATLRPESFPVLDSVVGLMERYPTMAIEVSGHTDNKGGPSHNQPLSEARAKAFIDYVISKGIESSRMKSKGYGAMRPLAPNSINGKDNPAGRQKNRRTEIKVLHY